MKRAEVQTIKVVYIPVKKKNSMIKIPNIYDFYNKFTEEQRKSSVGKCITDISRPDENKYFPIKLIDSNSNYGHKYGLIYLSPVFESRINIGKSYLKVCTFSPDDFDLDLEFEGTQKLLLNLRKKIERYIIQIPKTDVTYKSILLAIQEKFPSGILY